VEEGLKLKKGRIEGLVGILVGVIHLVGRGQDTFCQEAKREESAIEE